MNRMTVRAAQTSVNSIRNEKRYIRPYIHVDTVNTIRPYIHVDTINTIIHTRGHNKHIKISRLDRPTQPGHPYVRR